MKVIIDRFEGDMAVAELDVGKFVSIPRVLVNDAKEGDVVEIIVRKDETEKRKKYVKDLMNQLFQD